MRVIQGTTTNYGLTEKGREDIKEIVAENLEELSESDKIIASPYKRAQETAEIISEFTGKEIEVEPIIHEFKPGILGGKTHDENASLYPEYYKIWQERKDLDGIPGAETGKELQARALAFLMKYMDKDSYNDIVVSHAGFLRCLINTAKGRIRTTPVDSRNGAITVLENPLEKLDIEHKSRAMASKVYVVKTTDDKYVVKMKNREIKVEDREEKRILDDIQFHVKGLPQVLCLFDNCDRTCTKVLSFVNGESVFGKLDSEKLDVLMNKMTQINEFLSHEKNHKYPKEDLIEVMKKLEESSKRDYTKKYARSILSDSKNINRLKESEYCLAHNDLNRDNILFYNDNGAEGVNIIDWEGIGNFPKDYALATFLSSAILIEGYEVKECLDIAKRMESNIDPDYLTFLMKIRVFTGLHYFAENRNIYTQSNKDVSKEILKKYFFAAEKLDRYRIRNGFDENLQEYDTIEEKLEKVYKSIQDGTDEER